MAMTVQTVMSLVLIPFSLVAGYQGFCGTCCLHFQGKNDFDPEAKGNMFFRKFGIPYKKTCRHNP
jgi:hypothetical protein